MYKLFLADRSVSHSWGVGARKGVGLMWALLGGGGGSPISGTTSGATMYKESLTLMATTVRCFSDPCMQPAW